MNARLNFRKVTPIIAVAAVSFAFGVLSQPRSSGTISDVERAVHAETPATQAQDPNTATAKSAKRAAPTGSGIRKFTQHFNEPDADLSPWMFVPGDNIKEFSTRKHPGLATIYEAGKGKDIKGLLPETTVSLHSSFHVQSRQQIESSVQEKSPIPPRKSRAENLGQLPQQPPGQSVLPKDRILRTLPAVAMAQDLRNLAADDPPPPRISWTIDYDSERALTRAVQSR